MTLVINTQAKFSTTVYSAADAGDQTTRLVTLPNLVPPFYAIFDPENTNAHYEIVTVNSMSATNINHAALTYAHAAGEEVRISLIASEWDAISSAVDTIKTTGAAIVTDSATPTGAIEVWNNPTPKAGWLECNGASLLRADYAALFAIIGTTYGSADGTHFTLPDFSGRTAVGVDGTYTLGSTGGAKTIDISHSSHTTAAHTHTATASYAQAAAGPTLTSDSKALSSTTHTHASHSVTSGAQSADTIGAGGGSAINVVDAYFTVKYIIKYT